jgi:hypothetical protein
MAAEAVGEAVLIKTQVTGASGPLTVNGPVHRDERIQTSKSGLGQFVFVDGTKLAVGWGSSVVIDKFVFDDSKSVKKLTIKAAKGTFRWISGNSKSSAYEIVTPAGTIGVRGTAFDVYIGPDGTTAVVMLNGSAKFCGANGCKELKRRCDCVIAKRNGDVSDARRVDPGIFKTLGNKRALPFMSGNQKLSGMSGTACGLAMAAQQVAPARANPQRSKAEAPAPNKPDKPDKADKPDKPDKPDTPDTPDKPDKPDTPDKPDKPDKPDHDDDDHHDDHDGHHHDGEDDHDHDGKDHHGRDHHGRDHHGREHQR